MAHIFDEPEAWRKLTPEEKLDALYSEIGRLFGIVEMLSQKHHVFTDAINLLHRRLDEQAAKRPRRHAAGETSGGYSGSSGN